ncbi:MAG: OadG family transporter subunit [Lentisphaeria bacterium]|jgi:Na+-transporting methylmalonyl-CoA/oxaloacetate decarboxylase gamma subunit
MDLVQDGLVLLVLGQLAVFAFLGSMVLLVLFNAKWINAFLKPGEPAAKAPAAPAAQPADTTPVAAIAAAIKRFQAGK